MYVYEYCPFLLQCSPFSVPKFLIEEICVWSPCRLSQCTDAVYSFNTFSFFFLIFMWVNHFISILQTIHSYHHCACVSRVYWNESKKCRLELQGPTRLVSWFTCFCRSLSCGTFHYAMTHTNTTNNVWLTSGSLQCTSGKWSNLFLNIGLNKIQQTSTAVKTVFKWKPLQFKKELPVWFLNLIFHS